jgi:hypothetical protein
LRDFLDKGGRHRNRGNLSHGGDKNIRPWRNQPREESEKNLRRSAPSADMM